jgi:hypothetical protein
MSTRPISELIPVLEMAIGPVILISGVGLLLLTLTNRFGRILDRARALATELRAMPDVDRARVAGQITMLYHRARLTRASITLAVLGALLASVLIIALFCAALLQVELGLLISLLFVGCMGLVSASLVVFLWDMHLSLRALKLELGRGKGGEV